MAQAAEDAEFLAEEGLARRVQALGPDTLEGALLSAVLVAHAPDHAQAAFAQFLQQAVAPGHEGLGSCDGEIIQRGGHGSSRYRVFR